MHGWQGSQVCLPDHLILLTVPPVSPAGRPHISALPSRGLWGMPAWEAPFRAYEGHLSSEVDSSARSLSPATCCWRLRRPRMHVGQPRRPGGHPHPVGSGRTRGPGNLPASRHRAGRRTEPRPLSLSLHAGSSRLVWLLLASWPMQATAAGTFLPAFPKGCRRAGPAAWLPPCTWAPATRFSRRAGRPAPRSTE